MVRGRKVEIGLGGLVISMLAIGPKVCRFKFSQECWIFSGDKNP
jgi:hypothetical protein